MAETNMQTMWPNPRVSSPLADDEPAPTNRGLLPILPSTSFLLARSPSTEALLKKTDDLYDRLVKKHTIPSFDAARQRDYSVYREYAERIAHEVPPELTHPMLLRKPKKEKDTTWFSFMKETKSSENKKEAAKLMMLSRAKSVTPIPKHVAEDNMWKINDEPIFLNRTLPSEEKIEEKSDFVPAGIAHYLISLDLMTSDLAKKSELSRNQKRRRRILEKFQLSSIYPAQNQQFQFNIKLGKSIKKLWDLLPKDSAGNITEDVYYKMSRVFANTLLGEKSLASEAKLTKNDWTFDSQQNESMSFKIFHEMVFTLADIWIETAKIEDYAFFILKLVDDYNSAIEDEKDLSQVPRPVSSTFWMGRI